MLNKLFVPVALSSLLIASPLVMAVDEHHPEEDAEVTQDAPSLEEAPEAAAVTTNSMMNPGMMSGGQNIDSQGGMMMGRPGMMGPGMMKCRAAMMGSHGGMMRKNQQVMNRLDLLDARMAKIETMLERLMQR